MRLFCIEHEHVDKIWPHVKGYIQQSIVRGRSDQQLMHYYMQLKTHQSRLWIVFDGKQVLCAGTTEIIVPIGTTMRVCLVTSLGGRDMKLWRKFWSDIEQYARNENCDVIRMFGRKGWARVLRDDGYEQPWITLEKRLR